MKIICLKHISFYEFDKYDTSILYRMRNSSYYDTLDDESKVNLGDCLYERYVEAYF